MAVLKFHLVRLDESSISYISKPCQGTYESCSQVSFLSTRLVPLMEATQEYYVLRTTYYVETHALPRRP